MKILVTGGNGTVGKPLVQELRSRGHRVFVCDLAHDPDEVDFWHKGDPWHKEGVYYARCDVGEFRQVERMLSEFLPDVVYHTAAEFGRWNGEDFYEQLWRTNAVGTKNIIRMQEKLRFRLVHFSSSEVYGDWDGVMHESVPDEYPIHLMNDYAMTKWVNEMQIKNSVSEFRTDSVVVRLFNTYGPGEYYSPYRSVNCRFIYQALRGLPLVVHRGHRRTSTFVSDTVKTLALIAEKFNSGAIYNIGGDASHTIERLAELVVDAVGASRDLIQLAPTEHMTTMVKLVDIKRATQELGHQSSVSLEEGIRRTVDWMKSVYGK